VPGTPAGAGRVQVHVSPGTNSEEEKIIYSDLNTKYTWGTDFSEFPPQQNLVTVWSAPNYCYRCGNVAAILQFDEKLHRNFLLFNEVPESEQSMPPRTTVPYFF
jgi:hypothetical protein